jgi:D-glycero-alpha-D-manno-heptose-7-phosphate kinase
MALPVRVVLDLSDDGPPAVVRHRVADGPWRELGPDDASSDLTAAICFHLAPQGSLTVNVREQAPMGSGLGGSSTFGVALAKAVAAISEQELSDERLVNLVRDLEARLLGTLAGCQDHWAAVRGGVHAIHLKPGGNTLERLDVDPQWLESRFTVFFTGITHHSGMVNWQVIRRRLENDPATIRGLQAIADAAIHCRQGLLTADENAVGEALRKEWAARRRLAPEICPPELRKLESEAMNNGALAFKACGAGGGGSVIVWHQSGHGPALGQVLMNALPSGILVPRGIEPEGCMVRTL